MPIVKNNDLNIYEHPLCERMRLFMRLENIFRQMDLFHKGEDAYAIKFFLNALFDSLDFLHRYEIRSEILKELQRLQTALKKSKLFIGKDDEALEMTQKVDETLDRMHHLNLNPINFLRENELLNSLRQRNFNQTGCCLFEVPAYQFWINKHEKQQDFFLSECYRLFFPIARAIELILTITRNAAAINEEHTEDGIFLKNLNKNCHNQILRVHLPIEQNVFPRISGDKHRFAIRFMEQNDPQIRACQTNKIIKFCLQICVL